MARIQNLNVAGMSIEDIRQLDTRTLSDRALKQALNRLVSASNKRLRRLQADEYGKYSPTAQQTRKFSAKDAKTRGDIKAEFERARSFLDPAKKSHTVKGWRKIVKKMKEKGVTDEEMKDPDFWGLYRQFLKEYVPHIYDSNTLLMLLSSAIARGLTDEDEIRNYLDGLYEEREANEKDDFGDFEDEFGDYYE